MMQLTMSQNSDKGNKQLNEPRQRKTDYRYH